MQLGGLIEVIIYCEDMQAQVTFYRDVLGLDVTFPTDIEGYSGEHWVTFDTGVCTLALHSGGERRQGADAPKYVFATDDVETARGTLADRGVKVGEFRSPTPGIRLFEAWDPEGNIFTVEQHGA